MKLDEIKVGHHKVGGVFDISIQLPVFTTKPGNYFEVFVSQQPKGKVPVFVNLADDERFAIFKHVGTFECKLTEDDVVAYNSHVSHVFHRIQMPTFKLSRPAIVALFDKCQQLAKKLR